VDAIKKTIRNKGVAIDEIGYVEGEKEQKSFQMD
jgi:hydrogenase maturation factor HypE